jgi:hypothetical protein
MLSCRFLPAFFATFFLIACGYGLVYNCHIALAGDTAVKKDSVAGSSSAGSGVLSPGVSKRDAAVTVKTNTKEVTIEGEVVDTWCYCSQVMGQGRGEEHKKCARLCVSGGVTAGILADDGTLYIAAKHQGYKGCAGLLLPHVAERVKVKGWLAERGGCKVLKITSVERVSGSTAKARAKRP